MPNKDLRAEWKSSEKVSKPQYITDILIAIRKPRKVVREGTKADQYRRVASAARAASFKRAYRKSGAVRSLAVHGFRNPSFQRLSAKALTNWAV